MESKTESKKLYCYMCGNTVNTDDLVIWKHPMMDGGRPYEVCPVCAKRVTERNMDDEDDFYASFALSRSFVPMKE